MSPTVAAVVVVVVVAAVVAAEVAVAVAVAAAAAVAHICLGPMPQQPGSPTMAAACHPPRPATHPRHRAVMGGECHLATRCAVVPCSTPALPACRALPPPSPRSKCLGPAACWTRCAAAAAAMRTGTAAGMTQAWMSAAQGGCTRLMPRMARATPSCMKHTRPSRRTVCAGLRLASRLQPCGPPHPHPRASRLCGGLDVRGSQPTGTSRTRTERGRGRGRGVVRAKGGRWQHRRRPRPGT